MELKPEEKRRTIEDRQSCLMAAKVVHDFKKKG
jgi:hypothetical protein